MCALYLPAFKKAGDKVRRDIVVFIESQFSRINVTVD